MKNPAHKRWNAKGVLSRSPGLPKATLGVRPRTASTPTGLRHGDGQGRNPVGVGNDVVCFPRVGAARQPWAEGWNAVGVHLRLFMATLALALLLFTGCSSDDGGSTHVSGSMYYGTSFYDPWYYGDYYDDPDIIVTPPPSSPEAPPRPTHPIAPTPPPRPTQPIAPTPAPRPMPSIPSMPRASFRR